MYGYADIEEDISISVTISAAETPKGTISGILRYPDDLEKYLLERQRPYYHHLPFEGDLNIESFDFENYDYIFCAFCIIGILLIGLLHSSNILIR